MGESVRYTSYNFEIMAPTARRSTEVLDLDMYFNHIYIRESQHKLFLVPWLFSLKKAKYFIFA